MKLKTEWADVRVSNTDWGQRPYDIAATAHAESGSVTSVNSGSVMTASTDGMAASLASFHSNGGGSLTVNYQTDTDRAAILAAVEDFLAALKESVGNNEQ